MKKKILCLAAAAALLSGSLAPAPAAEAFSIGDIIGIAQGAAQYAMLDKHSNITTTPKKAGRSSSNPISRNWVSFTMKKRKTNWQAL